MCVRGSSLALGYYNNPQKTAEVFIQNPLNHRYPERIYRTGDMAFYNERGELIFTGRKDSQIKHMGYRIELGEIEHYVSTLEGVDYACVLYDKENKVITLFYEGAKEPEPAEFRKSLAGYLPKYALPTDIRRMEKLPKTPNGKIDRQKLASALGEEK